ncbi:GbsR/MarR family transcriptional regulator [Desulfobulbus alkaliphilus]|uniref:GbsR/MarR family transcriptional regulator n=1 Tax=Desulfobulbus alkaliphilus TaxID=869814 RepID=UPI001965F03C|nr:MarR family transcriptional regulator [Desulfobulbus alkaliphilus]MBM9538574.1 MarR family transcriptional regulator [Desulfobulbus alkaliphilus]
MKAQGTAIKKRLVASGGRLAQEFGFNRVAGQVLSCLYLTEGEASLDELERELGLSKAAVSLAATQLERLGLIHRVKKSGDRKRYYRSAEDIGSALQHGISTFARTKMALLEIDLAEVSAELADFPGEEKARFLAVRVARIRDLNQRAERMLDHPLTKLFSKLI